MSGRSQSETVRDNEQSREEWDHITDPSERRRVQNRVNQKRFRDKQKKKKEDEVRARDNQERAGAAYTVPDSEDLEADVDLPGLPWGGVSLKYVIEQGKARQSEMKEASRETSASSVRYTGGSWR
ncbi:hypothetical protein L228DRAFT_265249 [Xylona heveae TC161]|uniref:BZIP domain-containing protein n=1 Tax=Xylona heveae (strain CBS 132557 / TC161) TaxID=1328760 RepID=A0A165K207_XYLHT|nr:hypothetical protein L228DRAFT_265249 [Xylona heveae TC161]KZF26898.1 hypothetical protein L228DRAFT_265249 [Xylona heveae TC161]